MSKLYSYLLLVVACSLSSCEKVIDVDLNTAANQLVIEGVITDQNMQQTIKITESVPYTNSNIYPAVTGGVLTITDNQGNTWTPKESTPGNYTFGPMRGRAGRTYTLKAIVNNVTYNASSTMPSAVKLDSLGIRLITFGGSDRKQVEVHFTDPADQVNQYRWILKVNGLQAKQVFADNDQFTNGNAVTNILFYNDDDDSNNDFKAGDELEVEMQCIDKSIYTYWYTLSQQTQNGPGGGVTPGNPPSNIDNNALGYFSAHTTQKSTVIVN
jgi:hypothetical protein